MPPTEYRRTLLTLILAAIVVPTTAVLLLVVLALDASNPWTSVAVPAFAGVVVGVLALTAAARSRSTRATIGHGGSALIVTAAVVGTFANHLPTWSRAFLDGCVIGFFLAFLVLLRRRVARSEPPDSRLPLSARRFM